MLKKNNCTYFDSCDLVGCYDKADLMNTINNVYNSSVIGFRKRCRSIYSIRARVRGEKWFNKNIGEGKPYNSYLCATYFTGNDFTIEQICDIFRKYGYSGHLKQFRTKYSGEFLGGLDLPTRIELFDKIISAYRYEFDNHGKYLCTCFRIGIDDGDWFRLDCQSDWRPESGTRLKSINDSGNYIVDRWIEPFSELYWSDGSCVIRDIDSGETEYSDVNDLFYDETK